VTRLIAWMPLLAACSFGGAPATPPTPEVLHTVLMVDDVKGCNRCAMSTRVDVRKNPGIKKVHLDIATGQVEVIHLSDQVTATVLKQSLEDEGHAKVSIVSSQAYVPEQEPAEQEPAEQAAEAKDQDADAPSEAP